jgi:hypothetical protein
MYTQPAKHSREPAEKIVADVIRQLRNHAVKDSVLLFLPPTVALVYLLAQLYHANWISPQALAGLIIGAVALALLAIALRYRPRVPSPPSAARLVDEKTAGEDRFLTLTTIPPAVDSQSFLGRLRAEAASLVRRVELNRDFPYQLKRSFYWSIGGSALAVLLFHLLVPAVESSLRATPAHTQVSELAERMADRPRLNNLAASMRALAEKLKDPNVPETGKQQAIQETQKKIEAEQKRSEQKENQDLLAKSATTLKSLEQSSGNSPQSEQDKGGGIQSNLPEQGQGEGKGQGGGGDSKGGIEARQTKQMEQGKSTQPDPKESSKQKNQQNGADGKPDKNQPGKEEGKEMTGRTEGGAEEQSGKSKSEGKGRSEQNPQGPPPAERLAKPGEEGKGGLKGQGYVTVQLPEELTADGKADAGQTRKGAEAKTRAKVSVSNTPLPPHLPDAPSEKQNVPLEYRGVIR